jgi:pimeloyl-ACP methyl ester carboxylesterase
MLPMTKYAQSGDIFIAYQVSGSGPIDIVFAPGFISHLEHMWEDTRHARFFHGLESFARLIRFDKRGTGLSDRSVGFPTLDERIDDIRVVMDAAGSNRAVLLGISEGGAMIQLFAATYPERVSGLVLIGSYSNAKTSIPSYKDPKLAEAQILAGWGTGASLPDFAPGLASDPEFSDWWARFERLSASPSAVIKLRQMNSEIDVTPVLPSIQAPTLIIHRVDDVRCSVENARDMAKAIPNAKMVELPGKDHLVWLEESGTVLAEVRKFVDIAQEPSEPDRVLTTVLFTDIVDSTQQAAAVGDTEWRSVLDAHFSLARSQLRRFRGREVKTLGDGILATFDGPARAVRCAQAIVSGVRPLGIAIRAGLHTGEVEIREDDDIGGIAVNIASRVSHLAGSSEVWVSSTVKDLVAGSGLVFADLGPRAIKGLEEELRIFHALR